MNVFHHIGDIGDIIASLPIIRELGGGKLVISDARFPLGFGPREGMRGKRFEAFQPLVEATPYISSIEWHDDPQKFITHDIASFRSLQYWYPETLTQWQGRYFKLEMPNAPEPWLQVDAPQHGRIVVHHTPRYNTRYFPWNLIVKKYGKELLFLGLPEERLHFPYAMDYQPTANLLEAAKLIAGSRFLICNQSSLHWIAVGLGHPFVQETAPHVYARTAMVRRPNALYTDTNEHIEQVYDFLGLDKSKLLKNQIPFEPKINLSTSAGDCRKNLSTSAEIFEVLA